MNAEIVLLVAVDKFAGRADRLGSPDDTKIGVATVHRLRETFRSRDVLEHADLDEINIEVRCTVDRLGELLVLLDDSLEDFQFLLVEQLSGVRSDQILAAHQRDTRHEYS